MVVTMIVNNRQYQIELEEGTDRRSERRGWTVSRIARVDGLGMAYLVLRDRPQRETRTEAAMWGVYVVLTQECVDGD